MTQESRNPSPSSPLPPDLEEARVNLRQNRAMVELVRAAPVSQVRSWKASKGPEQHEEWVYSTGRREGAKAVIKFLIGDHADE